MKVKKNYKNWNILPGSLKYNKEKCENKNKQTKKKQAQIIEKIVKNLININKF